MRVSVICGQVAPLILAAVTTVPFSTSHAINHSQVNTGWTVGFGTEGKLLIPGWTYKTESLYKTLAMIQCLTSVSNAPLRQSGGLIAGHALFTDTILCAGLNYQFY